MRRETHTHAHTETKDIVPGERGGRVRGVAVAVAMNETRELYVTVRNPRNVT